MPVPQLGSTIGEDERVLMVIQRDEGPLKVLAWVLALPTLGLSLLVFFGTFRWTYYAVTDRRIIVHQPARETSIALTHVSGIDVERPMGARVGALVIATSRGLVRIKYVRDAEGVGAALAKLLPRAV